MNKMITKRIGAVLLSFAIALAVLLNNGMVVKAETTTTLYELRDKTAAAGIEVSFPFTLSKKSEVTVNIFIKAPVDASIVVYDSAGNPVSWLASPFTLSADLFQELDYGYYGYADVISNVSPGDYTYGITFSQDSEILIGAYAAADQAQMSQTKAVITEGFSKTLFVSRGTVQSWMSSKPAVAGVDDAGKVTGKKAGKTTVTAVLTDGQKVTCAVTVKVNQYKDSRLTSSDVKSGKCAMGVYRMAYDEDGSLVIKTSCVNNTSYQVTGLKSFKIKVKDKNGKTVGTYKVSAKKVTVAAKSVKRMKFTIESSALKLAETDLRNASVTITGKYVYNK